MRRFLIWLVWNVPLGRLAPHILGLALGKPAQIVYICKACNGTGHGMYEGNCEACNGTGRRDKR